MDFRIDDRTLTASLLFLIVAYVGYSRYQQRFRVPGPPRLPLLGNILQHPSQFQFIQYTKWAKDYGAPFDICNSRISTSNPVTQVQSSRWISSVSTLLWSILTKLRQTCLVNNLKCSTVYDTHHILGSQDRDSSVYNDRPRMIMLNEILGGGVFLPSLKYGNVYVCDV